MDAILQRPDAHQRGYCIAVPPDSALPRVSDPVRHVEDNLRSAQNQSANELRKHQVIANGQAKPTQDSINYDRPFTWREDLSLGSKQVGLAIDVIAAVGCKQNRIIVIFVAGSFDHADHKMQTRTARKTGKVLA